MENINHLHKLLFESKKALAEFERSDLETIDRLKEKTKNDPDNIVMFTKLTELQLEYNSISGRIKFLQALIKEMQDNPSTFDEWSQEYQKMLNRTMKDK